jgi:antitoxin component YwqK of YwqJK toxin-antitoxin module
VSYYPNTKIQSICNYTIVNDRRKGKVQSVPDGEWIFFDKNGVEVSRITYRNGERK